MGLMATAVGKDVIGPMVQDIMQAALKVHFHTALCPKQPSVSYAILVDIQPGQRRSGCVPSLPMPIESCTTSGTRHHNQALHAVKPSNNPSTLQEALGKC